MALVRAEYFACNVSAIGANMPKNRIAHQLRSVFIKDLPAPPTHARLSKTVDKFTCADGTGARKMPVSRCGAAYEIIATRFAKLVIAAANWL